MSIDFGITTNADQLIRQLNQFAKTGIPKAISKAEQRTVEPAQKRAKKSMEQQLHKPTKAAVNSVRRQFRSANDVKAGTGRSAVFVADHMISELWPNTKTEPSNSPKRITTNPDGGRGVMVPVRRVRNAAGNMRGLRSQRKLKQMRSDKTKFFEVRSTGKVKSKNGHLSPGIYEIRQLKRGRKIRLVVAFEKESFRKPRWAFREIVLDTYSEQFAPQLNKALSEEIAKIGRR